MDSPTSLDIATSSSACNVLLLCWNYLKTFTVLSNLAVTDVPFPELPRHSARRFSGPAPAHAWTTAAFRSQFFQVVDTAVNQLKVRYDQAGLHQYMQLENALMNVDTSADELKSVVSAYPEMDADRFAVQLAMLRQQNWKLESVEDVSTKLASAH